MPNKYKRKCGARKYADFEQQDLENAITDVADGKLSVRAAAEKYGVPKSTVHRKYHGQNMRKHGGQTILSKQDENHIVSGLLLASEWGFPFSKMELRYVVKRFLDQKGINEKKFKHNLPGRVWLKGFLDRHKDVLSKRMCENIKRSRAMVTPETINEYFNNLEITLENVPAGNIINYDETNMSDDPGQEVVIVRKGAKHSERIIDSTKTSTSVMFSIAGDGTLLPVYVVYKSKHVHDAWTENGPEGAVYNCSKSGWFDSFIFESWFKRIALEYLRRRDGEKVIIGDNLASHLSLSVISLCEKYNIKFVMLPPNSTHLTQPLDVAYFRPLKRIWKKNLLDWKKRNRGTLPKSLFPTQLKKTLDQLETSSQNAISGFRACGIVPLDRNQVLKRLPKKEDNKEVWSATFEESLRAARETQSVRQPRNKKNKVPAGRNIKKRAIVGEDKENEPQNIESATQMEIGEHGNNLSEEWEDIEIEENEGSPNLDNSNDRSFVPQSIQLNSFVLCAFIYNKGTKKEKVKKFVAKIIDFKDDEIYETSCLRYNEQYHCYIFPTVEDLAEITKTQILQVLPEPSVKRGRYTFNNLGKID